MPRRATRSCTQISPPLPPRPACLQYNAKEGYEKLNAEIKSWETDFGRRPLVGRLFYLALPPSVYPEVNHATH